MLQVKRTFGVSLVTGDPVELVELVEAEPSLEERIEARQRVLRRIAFGPPARAVSGTSQIA